MMPNRNVITNKPSFLKRMIRSMVRCQQFQRRTDWAVIALDALQHCVYKTIGCKDCKDTRLYDWVGPIGRIFPAAIPVANLCRLGNLGFYV